jgi:hypothetical protein
MAPVSSHQLSLPTARAKPTLPDELKRLHAKLAFYEQPITSFNRPVENEPMELSYRQALTQRMNSTKADGGKTNKMAAEKSVGACFLVRFARRAMTAMRSLVPIGRRPNGDTTRHGGLIQAEQLPGKKTLFTHRLGGKQKSPGNDVAVPHPQRRFQELDESTRFRLELAGIRVQSTPPSYTVCV